MRQYSHDVDNAAVRVTIYTVGRLRKLMMQSNLTVLTTVTAEQGAQYHSQQYNEGTNNIVALNKRLLSILVVEQSGCNMLFEISNTVRWSTITALVLVQLPYLMLALQYHHGWMQSIGMYSLAYTACLQSACRYAVDNTADGDTLGTVSEKSACLLDSNHGNCS